MASHPPSMTRARRRSVAALHDAEREPLSPSFASVSSPPPPAATSSSCPASRSSTPPPTSASIAALPPPRDAYIDGLEMPLRVGLQVDARDQFGKWLSARITRLAWRRPPDAAVEAGHRQHLPRGGDGAAPAHVHVRQEATTDYRSHVTAMQRAERGANVTEMTLTNTAVGEPDEDLDADVYQARGAHGVASVRPKSTTEECQLESEGVLSPKSHEEMLGEAAEFSAPQRPFLGARHNSTPEVFRDDEPVHSDAHRYRWAHIHYINWAARWDEWIYLPTDGYRIAESGTFTKHAEPASPSTPLHEFQQHQFVLVYQRRRMPFCWALGWVRKFDGKQIQVEFKSGDKFSQCWFHADTGEIQRYQGEAMMDESWPELQRRSVRHLESLRKRNKSKQKRERKKQQDESQQPGLPTSRAARPAHPHYRYNVMHGVPPYGAPPMPHPAALGHGMVHPHVMMHSHAHVHAGHGRPLPYAQHPLIRRALVSPPSSSTTSPSSSSTASGMDAPPPHLAHPLPPAQLVSMPPQHNMLQQPYYSLSSSASTSPTPPSPSNAVSPAPDSHMRVRSQSQPDISQQLQQQPQPPHHHQPQHHHHHHHHHHRQADPKLLELLRKLRINLEYASRFVEQEIEYGDLASLTEADLVSLIPTIGPRRRMQGFIRQMMQRQRQQQQELASEEVNEMLSKDRRRRNHSFSDPIEFQRVVEYHRAADSVTAVVPEEPEAEEEDEVIIPQGIPGGFKARLGKLSFQQQYQPQPQLGQPQQHPSSNQD